MSIAEQGSVRVVHGANDGVFDVAGETVAVIQESLKDAFNVPVEAFAYVNGEIVGEEYRLRANDSLEFVLPIGTKGALPLPGDSSEPIKSPFPYYGGKAKVAVEIWRRFGDVKNYVEPFFGSGAVLLNRPIVQTRHIETVNDMDALLVNFWRAAKFHPRKLAKAADYPVSELDLHARHSWLVGQRQEIQDRIREAKAWCDPRVAAWWAWGISQWIGGGWCDIAKLSHSRPSVGDGGRGMHRRSEGESHGEYLRRYFNRLTKRLERVNVLCGDWARLVTPSSIPKSGVTGVFLDPPYTGKSGRLKRLYAKDDLAVGDQVRDWAVENGDNPKLRIALCGYDGEYRMPRSWKVFEWKSQGSRSGHKERIWFSPHCLA